MSHLLAARRLPTVTLLIAVCFCLGTAEARLVRFETSLGNIDVRLYETATPISVANFLNYVTSNRYDGTFIHRVPQSGGVSANFVIQGGGFRLNNSIWEADGIVTDPPIANEPGISNIRGTLAFAKNALGATSQWFFNVGNNTALDPAPYLFTVFGRVVGDGMDVIDAINALDTINAAAAQDGPGEDFDEIPVTDFDQVIAQQDITSNEAVMVNDVQVLNFPEGDYDFNGIVDAADHSVWHTTFGSTTNAAADGNGDGRVDASDYLLWRKMYSDGGGGGSNSGIGVPEPSSGVLFLIGLGLLTRRRRRITCVGTMAA